MNNKPFEQWWAGLEATDKPGCRYVKIDYRKIHMDEAEARELHAQIIEAADYAMPCTIMRRFAQMDDSPLGCYVPVAYCDHYGQFEELIEAAGKPHALICIQRQEEKRKPKPEPKAEPIEATEEADDDENRYKVWMRYKGEEWIERGRFDTQEDANLFTHEDGAFSPPGQREYLVLPSDEQPEPELGHFQGGSIVLESRGENVKTIRLDDIHDAFLHEDRISIVTAGKQMDTVCFSSKAKLKAQWDAIQQNISARGMKLEPIDDSVPSGKRYESVDAMLKDQGAHDTRAELLSGEVDILRKELNSITEERDKLRTELARLKKIAADYVFNGLQSGYVNEFRDAIDDYLPKK